MSRVAVSVTKTRLARYSLTLETFESLIALQDRRCAICQTQFSRKAILENCALVIDHDHETGKVRGLLCRRCNTALGQFRDNRQLLVAAAAYLQVSPVEMLSALPKLRARIAERLNDSISLEITEYLQFRTGAEVNQ